MADYIKYLYKTVRKYFGEAIVVTQEAVSYTHLDVYKRQPLVPIHDRARNTTENSFVHKIDENSPVVRWKFHSICLLYTSRCV